MVGNGPEGSIKSVQMSPGEPKIDPERLAQRLMALVGIERVREAAVGLSAYLVGGAVRDLLIGRERADIDVAVEGEVAELAQRLGGEVLAHGRFATATVRADGLEVDLATTRAETYDRPGALPDVRRAPLADDLARRDFTINAMAVPLAREPELIDPHGGLVDLRRGELRILHDDSFTDDPTRALRAARYAARLGFALEHATAERLREADLTTVSSDRVEAELRKMAAEPEARRGFELVAEWGLLEVEPDATALIEEVDGVVSAEPWRAIVSRNDAVLAAALGRGVDEAKQLAGSVPARPSQAADLAHGHSGVELALARAMGAEWLDRYLSEWREVRLEIDGDDLLAQGIPEGPAIGRGLAEALRAKLDGEIAGRDEELRAALAAARENSAE
jgi:tRNA nucleotidyltransferase (CCA-adding enzyme)